MKRIPCVDDAAFLVIQRAYDEIDFYGEFKKGNEEVYEERSIEIILLLGFRRINLCRT